MNQNDFPPSKSQKKREMHALQAMGKELTELSQEKLESLPLGEDLLAAIAEYKRLKGHEAKRRQLQYIGRLMRSEDADAVGSALADLKGLSLASAKNLHELEEWRETLLNDPEGLTRFVSLNPGCDVQHLRQLQREAKREEETGKPAGAGRRLFRFLREIQEKKSF